MHDPRHLLELDREYLWHPFTPMREWLEREQLVIDRAAGNELIDIHGRHYIDGVSSLWVNIHGHRRAELNQAINDQLHRVAHTTLLGLASTPSILLAEALIRRAPPGLRRVFYSDSGSTSVEVALKIAFQYQMLAANPRRKKFLVFEQSYHGDTIGAVSLGAIDVFHGIFGPLLFETVVSKLDLAHFGRVFDENQEDLCAVVIEPLVQGAGGMRLAPPGLLAAAAERCRKHDVLLIADEVATGFGRTGTLFACEQERVTPDLLCCAKGLSGGYLPLAATLATEAVFERFLGAPRERLTFFHGHSFTGNPLACAAALASLQLFDTDRVLEGLPAKIDHLRARMAEDLAPLSQVKEIRQRGLMVGVEVQPAPGRSFPDARAIGAEICDLVRKHGVILRPLGSVIVILPPLSITAGELDRIVAATRAAILEAIPTEHPAPERATEERAPAASAQTSPGSTPRDSRRPHTGLFVAGTDTAAGKTTVSRALLRLCARTGHPVLPCKPVETGCAPEPSDALLLRRASGLDLPLERVCPHRFSAPLAPSVAARLEHRALSLDDLIRAVRDLRPPARPLHPVLVESAGGLLSPLTPTETNAELAARLALPILLVAPNRLGVINHVALVFHELRRRGLRLFGLILTQGSASPTPDATSNATAIAELTGVTPLGCLPYLDDATRADDERLADALSACLAKEARSALLAAFAT